MRTDNKLKRVLGEGKSVLGTWSVLPSTSVANVIASAGFDFIIIDMEHGPSSFETAEDMVRAVESEGCTPLVRVPANQDWLILRALEIGTHGVVVPQITDAAEARKAIHAIKYYPEGLRGFSPFTRSAGYAPKNTREIAGTQNARTLSVLLVEGVSGIANLDGILEVSGIDVIYLGTYDLSQSAGYPGQPDHPEVLNYIRQCTVKIMDKGISVGILAQTEKDMANWLGLGIRFIAYQADCALLAGACEHVRSSFNARNLL